MTAYDRPPRVAALVAMGWEVVKATALAGELPPGAIGLAMRGAKVYHEAIRAGDIASYADALARAETCARCPRGHIVWEPSKLSGVETGYCGGFLRSGPGRCGCHVAVRINGAEIQPGAKTWVASEACPSGEWGAVGPGCR